MMRLTEDARRMGSDRVKLRLSMMLTKMARTDGRTDEWTDRRIHSLLELLVANQNWVMTMDTQTHSSSKDKDTGRHRWIQFVIVESNSIEYYVS